MSYTPAQIQPTLYQGDTFAYLFTFEENGSAFDLTTLSDISFRFFNEKETIFEHTVSGGDLTISGASNNELSGTASAETMDIGKRSYYLEVTFIFSDGSEITYLAGRAKVIGAKDGASTSAKEFDVSIDTGNETVEVEQLTGIVALAIDAEKKAEQAYQNASKGSGLNPEYVSTVLNQKPKDYVPGTGIAFGSYPIDDGLIQNVQWNDSTSQWDNFGDPFSTPSFGNTSFTKKIESVAGLQSEPGIFEGLFNSRPTRQLLGYKNVGDGGGGVYWDASQDKQNHNGITVFSPTHNNSVFGDTQDPNWYAADPDDIGTGVWKRVQSTRYVRPEWAGLVGDGTDETVAIRALFNTGIPDFSHIKDGTVYGISSNNIQVSYKGSFEIDFGGASFVALGSNMLRLFTIGVEDGTMKISNFTADAANKVVQPLFLKTEDVGVENIIAENINIINTFEDSQNFEAYALQIIGPGENCAARNIIVNGVDSIVGGKPTGGTRIGITGKGFQNVECENHVYVNVTEQGGTAIDDSDCLKVFGDDGPTKSQCSVNNITHISNGVSCKRTVKLQVDKFTVSGIYTELTNCEMLVSVNPQYGSGSIKDVVVEADNADLNNIVIGPHNDGNVITTKGNCKIDGVYANGVNGSNISAYPFQIDMTRVDNPYVFEVKNIVIEGFSNSTAYSFTLGGVSTNKTSYIFENIDCTNWAIDSSTLLAFNGGNNSVLNPDVYRTKAVFRNVNFPFPIPVNGSNDTTNACFNLMQVYEMKASNVINDVAVTVGNVGRQDYAHRLPSQKGAIYKYEWTNNPDNGQDSGTNLATTLHIPFTYGNDGANIQITIGRGLSDSWLEKLFVISWDLSISKYVFDEFTNYDLPAAPTLDGSTLSQNDTNKTLTLSFENLLTFGRVEYIKIHSLDYFEVQKVLNHTTYN